ncbi:MAG: di-heme oxidoredictase family protein [Pseudomonadota bacterium]
MKANVGTGRTAFGLRGGTLFAGIALLALQSSASSAEETEHLAQEDLVDMIKEGKLDEAFELAFEHGDELFETIFVAPDGIGANVGNGALFTRVPRRDLSDPGAWATHVPTRITGPNAAACNGCHNKPFNDGAGGIAVNVVRDPLMTGNPADYIERNTPHLFGSGAVQRLAEEMTTELRAIQVAAKEAACAGGQAETVELRAKGVGFGTLTAIPSDTQPCLAKVDASGIEGVDADLVVRPFRWKGADTTVRQFVRDAANNELGLQPVELVGHGVDGDHDGVVDELSVGDISAMEIYVAAQPRPVTQLELAEHGVIEPLTPGEVEAITRGEQLFAKVGCDECHRPTLTVDNPVFTTPSQHALYRDEIFPGGLEAQKEGVNPVHPVSYDMTRDLPDNIIEMADGSEVPLGVFERTAAGGASVPLYADLKRHDMGPELADAVDETGTGRSVWLTRALWGVGSTDPYLHDGRATTLEEAILAHGGEAQVARDAYASLSDDERGQITAFLENLVLYRTPEEEEEEE